MVWVPVGLLGGVGVYSWLWLTDFDRQHKKLPALLDEATKLGMPVDVKLYGATMKVPEDENAAGIYAQIAALINKLDPEIAKTLGDIRGRDSETSLPARSEEILAATEEIDALLGRAAERRSWATNSLARTENIGDFRETASIRTAFKASLLRVDRDRLSGNAEAALDRLRWMQRTIGHAFCEPVMMTLVISAALQTLWLDALNRLVRSFGDREDALDQASALLDCLPDLPSFKDALLGEVAYVLVYGQTISELTIDEHFPKGTPFPLNKPYFRSARAREAYVAYAVETQVRRYREMPEDQTDWVRIGQVLQIHRTTRDWWRRPIYAYSIHNFNIAETIPTRLTRVRMARQGIELFRVRNRSGSFPPQLPLTGADELDARSGRPLTYAPGANSFTLKAQNLEY